MLFDANELERFCFDVFVRHRVPDADDRLVAESLVTADLRGVESHGGIRLKIYADRLRADAFNPRTKIQTVRETRWTAVVDGDNGPVEW